MLNTGDDTSRKRVSQEDARPARTDRYADRSITGSVPPDAQGYCGDVPPPDKPDDKLSDKPTDGVDRQDSNLGEVIQAWPSLPEPVRVG